MFSIFKFRSRRRTTSIVYAKCGSIVNARRMFETIHDPNLGNRGNLVQHGEMKPEKVIYSVHTLLTDLKSCSMRKDLQWGRRIHGQAVKNRHDTNMFVVTALIRMYGKCGSMVDARRVFDSIHKPDVVSWTTLLLGYTENGQGLTTLVLFSNMKACGCAPDFVTYVAALKACASLAGKRDDSEKGEWLKKGRQIHSEIGFGLNIFVQCTLIDMYATCGSMVDAQEVFDSIREPNMVSWNALLLGYADNRQGNVALDLFSRMNAAGICVPDSMTYVAVLKACGSIGALAIGRKFHSEITHFNVHVVTCLVDFYAKCGSMEEAIEVFYLHWRARNMITWTALLAGYGRFGDTGSVFKLFEAMQDQGFRPNAVTFVCILSCCSHAGLVEKARELLEAMPLQYGIIPSVMHYTCMVDVLGRANKLDEAVAMLQKMPCNPNAVTWMTLLGACHKWKSVEIGRLAFQSSVAIDEKNAAAYVLMAHIYGSRCMREEQEKVLVTRMKCGAWKLPEQAYVMDGFGKMIKFQEGEEVSPEILDFLESMQEHGHSNELDRITRDVADGEKEETLCGHSERRAVVYGILNTSPGEPVRAFKNMRMCDDCHRSTKMFSKLLGRVIMVRDESRFHVMNEGNCSCGEYW